MPTPTYKPIATVTMSGTGSVTFTNINQSFKDLVLVARVNTSTIGFFFVYVNDTPGIYTQAAVQGNGSTTSSWNYVNTTYMNFADTAYSDPDANLVAHFFDYSASDKEKTVISTNTSPIRGIEAVANRAATTSPITSMRLQLGATANYGTVSLYGIVG